MLTRRTLAGQRNAVINHPPSWVVLVGFVVFLWLGFAWLTRHALVAVFILGFLRGLLGGRR
jgi:hypothetical protein